MTDQMKQRIVGIFVLVFLALIILPWLFSNNQSVVFETKKKAKRPAELAELVDEPDTQKLPTSDSQFVAAKVNVKKPEPLALEPLTKPNVAHKDHDIAPSKTEISITPTPEVNATKLTKIEAQIVTRPHSKAEVEHPKSSSKELVLNNPNFEKILQHHKKPAAKKVAPQKIPKVEKSWAVQMGTFNNKINAEKLIKELKKKGYPAYAKTSGSGNDKVTRVFVGPEVLRTTAESHIKKIAKTFKLQGVIVKANL